MAEKLSYQHAVQHRINIVKPTGLIAEAGHMDMSAYQINTGMNLKRPHILRRRHRVRETQDFQSIQVDGPSLIGRVKNFVGAAFVAPIRDGDFAMPDPNEFLAEHEKHDRVYNNLIDSNSAFQKVTTVEDLFFNVINNKDNIGIMKSVEGLYVNENYKEVIDELKKRGIVSVGLMWNFDSLVGCTTKPSVRDDKEDTGLTDLGKDVVAYLDENDMIIDLSHASDKTIKDVLRIKSKNPRIFTHSASRAVKEHNRNVTDEVARAIIEGGNVTIDGEEMELPGGGIIGIPFVGPFIGDEGNRNVDQVAAHIQHFKELGLLHGIALGSDFNGTSDGGEIKGLEDITVVHESLTQALLRRGFEPEEIDMVMYGNSLDFWLKHLPIKNSEKVKEKETETVVYLNTDLPMQAIAA